MQIMFSKFKKFNSSLLFAHVITMRCVPEMHKMNAQ